MTSSTPTVDPSPFDLGPRDARAAVLCLHGLTGTPYEVRPLGQALADIGMRALGPALPGHNQNPEALARVRHEEWLHAARAALESLRAAHARVALVGLSLGGLISLALAAESWVDAVAVVATPLRLRIPLLPLLPALRHLVPFVRKTRGSDICDEAARARHPSYDRMPLASVGELRRLQVLVRGCLARIQSPILVAQGRNDTTTHPDDAHAIVAAVGSAQRELLWLASSGHVVPVDRDGPRLALAVAAHCARFA